ncbi:MAG: trypsin-like peptidase domain-containing protein [Deltaproteobacteria bacterium]|nr:trypsin-like peptidase domain-containing protein [Deltaproteobacteria bacterium]
MRGRLVAAIVLAAAITAVESGACAQELTEATRVRLGGVLTRSTVTIASGSGTVGSGFVVDRTGRILTNLHVIPPQRAGPAAAGAQPTLAPQPIEIRYSDGRTAPGKVIATLEDWDLALVEPTLVGPSPPPLRLGDSDRARVGQTVLAVGAPFGLGGTLTLGILSARRALPLPSGGTMRDVLQTDAAINPGNSGGPLADARGRVVGVSTAIFSRSGGNQGIGFAVPSNAVRDFLEEVRRRESEPPEPRPWIGLDGVQFVDQRVRGVLVTSIAPGSPASAGFGAGAACGPTEPVIVWAVDSHPVRTPEELDEAIVHHQPGARVTLSLYCTSGGFKETSVVVGSRE